MSGRACSPYPWVSGGCLVYSSQGRVLADLAAPLPFNTVSANETEANVLLMAAAPELLEAAKLALRIAESGIHDEYDGTSMVDDMLAELEPARLAIAHAEGRTP